MALDGSPPRTIEIMSDTAADFVCGMKLNVATLSSQDSAHDFDSPGFDSEGVLRSVPITQATTKQGARAVSE
jgi:hypothetical protein